MASNVRKLLMVGVGSAVMAGLGLAACQSYEFDQVEPKAFGAVQKPVPIVGKMQKPYIMLVIDKSGSMLERADDPAEGSKCKTGGVYDSDKPCKWNDLMDAFADPTEGFLPSSSNLANFGLAAFPDGDLCDAGKTLVPLNPDNSNIDTVMAELAAIMPSGGTPVAPTLDAIARDPLLSENDSSRMRFVMLLTDGLPNCNPTDENAARCLSCNDENASIPCRDVERGGCYPTFDLTLDRCDEAGTGTPIGSDCLDQNGTVAAIKALRAKGIDTFVIGFGLDTAAGSVGAGVLDAAAAAGGRPRQGGGAKYYQAGNKEDLRTALEEIIAVVQSCDFPLDPPPSSENVMQVVLYDSEIKTESVLKKGTDWEFADSSLQTLKILNPQCETLQNAVPNRYEVRFLYASSM